MRALDLRLRYALAFAVGLPLARLVAAWLGLRIAPTGTPDLIQSAVVGAVLGFLLGWSRLRRLRRARMAAERRAAAQAPSR